MLVRVKLFFKMLKKQSMTQRNVNEISRASPATDDLNCAEQEHGLKTVIVTSDLTTTNRLIVGTRFSCLLSQQSKDHSWSECMGLKELHE